MQSLLPNNKAVLSIEVTTCCNSNCSHCFVRPRSQTASSLPAYLVRELVIEGFNCSYRHLHITGGEPLLWPGLFETLHLAFDLGYQTVFVNTNGILLTRDLSESFAVYPNLSISVSLEGPEPINDTIRGKGSYRMATAGIQSAIGVGLHVTIFTGASKRLLPLLPYFADEIYNKYSGIERLTLIPLIMVREDNHALSSDFLSPEEFLCLLQTIALLNLYGFNTDVLNEPLVNVASKLLQIPWIPNSDPFYRKGNIIVLATGEISLTHSTAVRFGRYENGIIPSVLSSIEYQEALTSDSSICSSCKYSALCHENNLTQPSEIYDSITSGSTFCKRVLDCILQH